MRNEREREIRTIPLLFLESRWWLLFLWGSTHHVCSGSSLCWDWHYVQHPAHWLPLPHNLPTYPRHLIRLLFFQSPICSFVFTLFVVHCSNCSKLCCSMVLPYSSSFFILALTLSIRAMSAGDRPGVGKEGPCQLRRQTQHALHAGTLSDRFLKIVLFWYFMCRHEWVAYLAECNTTQQF